MLGYREIMIQNSHRMRPARSIIPVILPAIRLREHLYQEAFPGKNFCTGTSFYNEHLTGRVWDAPRITQTELEVDGQI